MPRENEAIVCPRCRVPMNRHAQKPEYSDDPDVMTDPALGIVVVEVHACPECGESASRRAAPREKEAVGSGEASRL
jgi:hypothetical protein